MHTAPVRRSLGRGLTNQGRNDDPQGPVAERDVERERLSGQKVKLFILLERNA